MPTYTPYNRRNAAFSQTAHECAQLCFYPSLFGVDSDAIKWDDNTLLDHGGRGQVLDGEMGIDRVAYVSYPGLRSALVFTIQERFRRFVTAEGFRAKEKRDVTITEWNNRSNLPSELYKIAADLFVYGYFSKDDEELGEVIAFDLSILKLLVGRGEIRYARFNNGYKDQDFIAIDIDAIRASPADVYHHFPLNK